MQRRPEYVTPAMYGYVVFTSVAVCLLLLAMGHRGFELFGMLGLFLTVIGIQALIDKFLFDKYGQ